MLFRQLATTILSVILTCTASASTVVNFVPNDWTTFSASNSCQNCNLSGYPNYSQSGHQNADLQGANLSNSSFIAFNDYSNSNFIGANLSQAVLNQANLSESNFENAQFQSAIANGANFTGTNLSGANFTHAVLSGADFLNATGISDQQIIAQAYTVCNTILPSGAIGNC